jgi:hypothetical protein
MTPINKTCEGYRLHDIWMLGWNAIWIICPHFSLDGSCGSCLFIPLSRMLWAEAIDLEENLAPDMGCKLLSSSPSSRHYISTLVFSRDCRNIYIRPSEFGKHGIYHFKFDGASWIHRHSGGAWRSPATHDTARQKKSWFRFDSVANNLQLAWRIPLDLHRVELAQNILDRWMMKLIILSDEYIGGELFFLRNTRRWGDAWRAGTAIPGSTKGRSSSANTWKGEGY